MAQIRFLMTGADEQAFLCATASFGPALLLPAISAKPEPTPLSALPGAGEPGWFQLYLWNPTCCSQPHFVWVERRRHYVLDANASEVIELLRCISIAGHTAPGRLWIEPHGWKLGEPAVVISKSDAFVRWYRQLAGWIRRQWLRSSHGLYLGPAAAALAPPPSNAHP